jgi:tRNA G18 (ribose-2'-O)-methylase SpoU
MPLDPPLEASHAEIRDGLRPLRNGLSIAVLAAGNPFAIGAMIRVAHSFLVREIILVGTDAHYEKASMGMEKLETIVRVPDPEAFFTYLGGRPVFAYEREQARRSYHEVPSYPDDVVLAFGSERFGVPEGFLERCDDVLAIPLYGVNNSLPVAIACGIALAEWARRRYAPGTIV